MFKIPSDAFWKCVLKEIVSIITSINFGTFKIRTTKLTREKKAIVKKLNANETALSDESELNASEIAMHEIPNVKSDMYEKIKLAGSKNTKLETEIGIKIETASWIKKATEHETNFAKTSSASDTGNKKSSLHVWVLYSSDQLPIVNIGMTTINTKGNSEKK